jgi:hypothetical protein
MTYPSEYFVKYRCDPATPKKRPPTKVVTDAFSGLRERMANCPLCGKEVGYTDLYGYSGHVRADAPPKA